MKKNQEHQDGSNSISTMAPLISGFSAGIAGTILLYPLDLIKVRWQVNENRSTVFGKLKPEQKLLETNTLKIHRKSVIHSLRTIIKYEGLLGIYQGLTPSLVGSAVSWGGYFYLYERMKGNLLQYYKNNSNAVKKTGKNSIELRPADNFVCAVLSGSTMVLFTNPIWLIKTRMQLQLRKNNTLHANSGIKHAHYLSMYDAFRTIVKDEGVLALYKGAVPALLLSVHGGVVFVSYEFLKRCFGNYKKEEVMFYDKFSNENTRSVFERLHDSLGYLTMGAISKMIASTMTYPLQLIKSRLQARSQTLELTESGETRIVKRHYNGIMDCVLKIWKYEGIHGFFKGCVPNAIKVAPNAAITFVVYETMMDMFLDRT